MSPAIAQTTFPTSMPYLPFAPSRYRPPLPSTATFHLLVPPRRLPLTAYSLPALTPPDAARGVPATMFDAIAIMSVSMFDLATSHNGEGLFLFELGLLTTSLLMQWNIKLEEAFIITTPNSARLDTMSTPVSTFFAMHDIIDETS
ncbi:hypothetical protein M405DRAFT_841654 [Rhizopogon salebrosus TDB-379]|nr:hypothetical protein M405DRAFT_841654 [Rhizopogon salebrosus TDB-379]